MKQKANNAVPVMMPIYMPLENVPTVGNATTLPLEGKVTYNITHAEMTNNPEWMSCDRLMKYSSTHSGVSVTVFKAMSLLRGFLGISHYPNLATDIGRIKFIKGDQVSVINIKNDLDEPAVGIDDGSNRSSGFIASVISGAIDDLVKYINKSIVDIIRGN